MSNKSKKVPFTAKNILAAVARCSGKFKAGELEVVEQVRGGSADVCVKRRVKFKAGRATSWHVSSSVEYERRTCVECIQIYLREGFESVLHEFEPEVVLRAAARSWVLSHPELKRLRRHLVSELTEAGFEEDVVDQAREKPVEYLRLMHWFDPDEAVRVLFEVGKPGRSSRRFADALLEESGGMFAFCDDDLTVTEEGFVVEENS